MKRLFFILFAAEMLLVSGCATGRLQPDVALAQEKLQLVSNERWKQVHFLPPEFSDFERLHSERRVLVFQSRTNASIYRLYYPVVYEKGGGSAHYVERGHDDGVRRSGGIDVVECFWPATEDTHE